MLLNIAVFLRAGLGLSRIGFEAFCGPQPPPIGQPSRHITEIDCCNPATQCSDTTILLRCNLTKNDMGGKIANYFYGIDLPSSVFQVLQNLQERHIKIHEEISATGLQEIPF